MSRSTFENTTERGAVADGSLPIAISHTSTAANGLPRWGDRSGAGCGVCCCIEETPVWHTRRPMGIPGVHIWRVEGRLCGHQPTCIPGDRQTVAVNSSDWGGNSCYWTQKPRRTGYRRPVSLTPLARPERARNPECLISTTSNACLLIHKAPKVPKIFLDRGSPQPPPKGGPSSGNPGGFPQKQTTRKQK